MVHKQQRNGGGGGGGCTNSLRYNRGRLPSDVTYVPKAPAMMSVLHSPSGVDENAEAFCLARNMTAKVTSRSSSATHRVIMRRNSVVGHGVPRL